MISASNAFSENNAALDNLCINSIRTLAIDAIEKANSGHPGLPMGAAPMAYMLWQHHLRFSPQHPDWTNRDRFVLSAGHGSALLYAMLHLFGYELSLDDLKAFRQWQSLTPGHPEIHLTPGVECTTGPLGQGAANAVGMAMAERKLAAYFNRPDFAIVDHHTYALVGDGDLMEGVVAEAASLAGHLKLGKLIYLYDANDISLDGPTSLSFTEDVAKRFESYHWHVQHVDAGDTDLTAINDCITAAKAITDKPSLIIVKTTIGFGSPNKAGTSAAHGAPLGADEVAKTKANLGWEATETFFTPPAALEHMRSAMLRGQELVDTHNHLLEEYSLAHPELAAEWQLCQDGQLPANWQECLPAFEKGSSIATRSASGKVLNALANALPEPMLFGGDADLSCSTKTGIAGAESFDGLTGMGRNIHFGVREHAMAAAAVGMDCHGAIRPYVSTFFAFIDYLRPSLRLAALNGQPVHFIFTHDSIAVGEDGPTHQPVEQLASARCISNVTVLRPADANETVGAWQFAMQHQDGPVVMVLSRQNLPVLDNAAGIAENVAHGAYIISEAQTEKLDGILIATGSEVALAIAAQTKLAENEVFVRVVSMPSWELFQQSPPSYHEKILPADCHVRMAIEAGSTMGWQQFVGERGGILGIDGFGSSAPGGTVLENYGFTVPDVVACFKELR